MKKLLFILLISACSSKRNVVVYDKNTWKDLPADFDTTYIFSHFHPKYIILNKGRNLVSRIVDADDNYFHVSQEVYDQRKKNRKLFDSLLKQKVKIK